MSALLQLDGVDVDLGRSPRVRILHDVSLRVRPGEVVGIVGESGSGKTTLARTVLGAVAAASGSVVVDGTDIGRLRGRAIRAWRRSGTVQYVFQDPLRSLDPRLPVRSSIAEGPRLAGLRRAEVDERVGAAIAATDLDPALADRFPSQLSGGQRQRAAIARALAVRPRLLVLDEPVSALDAAGRDRVIRSLTALRDERGTDLGMVVISHDIGSLAALSDRLVVLYRGRVVEDGPTREVVATPRHPYTRLLISSVPIIGTTAPTPAERHALRALVDA